MPQTARGEHLYPLTGARFFLAAWVVILHLHELSPWFGSLVDESPFFIRSVVMNGAAGVGAFFVLSGFILAFNYDLAERWPAARRKKFWLARLARVYPVYLVGLILAGGWWCKTHLQHHLMPSTAHVATNARVGAEVLLLLQSWVPSDASAWNAPSWSLSVEAFFYLMFPFLGVAFWRVTDRWKIMGALIGCWSTLVGLTLLLMPAILAEDAAVPGPALNFTKWNPVVRLPEFLAGILLCHLFQLEKGLIRRHSQWLLFGGVAGILIPLAFLPQRVYPLLVHNGLLMPAICAVILGLAGGGGAVGSFLSNHWMVRLGEASFALYLIHIPAYLYVAGLFKLAGKLPATATIPFAFFFTAVAMSVVLQTYCEKPARVAILTKFGSPRQTIEPERSALSDPM